ncbi:MAG TPA: DnaA regulatory inactivator Hda [Burkholderiales bacterium]
MQQLPLEISAAPEPTLENFIAGANTEALARLAEMAAGLARETFLYLWGGAGSGRTHLLRAAAAAARGLYRAPGEPLPEAPPTLLALDDVDRLDAAGQHAAFNAANAARESGRIVVAAGNAPPAQLTLREDLRTRLGWGLVYRLHPLDDEAKTAWLRDEAARRGLRLGDGVTGYLLTRLPRGLDSLAAVVALLDRHSLARQRQVTLPLVREALQTLEERAR